MKTHRDLRLAAIDQLEREAETYVRVAGKERDIVDAKREKNRKGEGWWRLRRRALIEHMRRIRRVIGRTEAA